MYMNVYFIKIMTIILNFSSFTSALRDRNLPPHLSRLPKTLRVTSPRPPIREKQSDQRPLVFNAESTSRRRTASTQRTGMAAQVFGIQVQYWGLLSCPWIRAGGFPGEALHLLCPFQYHRVYLHGLSQPPSEPVTQPHQSTFARPRVPFEDETPCEQKDKWGLNS